MWIKCDLQARGGTGVDEGLVVSGTHWVTLNGAFTGSRTGAGSFTLDRCTATIKYDIEFTELEAEYLERIHFKKKINDKKLHLQNDWGMVTRSWPGILLRKWRHQIHRQDRNLVDTSS